jgi:hypothetical protein
MVGKTLGAAEEADEAVHLVVPRLEILVGDRPVVTQAVMLRRRKSSGPKRSEMRPQ